MTPERYEQIAQIFTQAREAPVDERPALLDRLCGEDKELRREVEAYLAAEAADAPSPLSAPVLHNAILLASAFGVSAEHLSPGKTIGPYRIVRKLGEGGFGTVYLAEQLQPIQRQVALKVIKPGMDSAAVIARFEHERQALAIMDHPHVARVIDAGTTPNGYPYFVMEYVDGEPINKFCDRHRLTIKQRLELFIPVCEAVQHAHMKGVIHRDLTPNNILVAMHDGRPVPKVIDFGIAKAVTPGDRKAITAIGQLIGTPEYMSPEQAMRATDIDTRTDVYSLGVVLYELLSGVPPFDSALLRGAGEEAIRRIIAEEDAPKPSTKLSTIDERVGSEIAKARQTDREQIAGELRRELEWIPLKAIRKERERRYASPAAVAADIRQYILGRSLDAAPDSRIYRIRKFVKRNRVGVGAAISVIGALGVGLAVSLWYAVEARNQAVNALKETEARKAVTDLFTNAVRTVAYSVTPPGSSSLGGANVRLADVLQALEAPVGESDVSRHVSFELAVAVGETYAATGRYRDADRLLSKAASQSVSSSQLAMVERRLASALRIEGKELDRAQTLAANAATILSAAPGPLSYEGALALIEHASSSLACKHHTQALGILERLEQRLDELTDRREEVLALVEAYRGEAAQSSETPDLTEAVRMYQSALARLSSHRNPFDPDVRDIRTDLASALSALGRSEEAIAMFESAATDATVRYGNDSIPVATLFNNLAVAYCNTNKFVHAISACDEALRIYDKHLGADSLPSANTRNTLAWAKLNAQQNEGVEDLLRQAIAVFEREEATTGQFGPAGWQTLNARLNLADTYKRKGRYDAAAVCYQHNCAALETADKTSDARYSHTVALWADARMDSKQWGLETSNIAMKAYDLCALYQPTELPMRAWRGSRALVFNGEFARAVEFWSMHLARPSAESWNRIYLAEALLGAGELDAAEECLRQASPGADPNPGYLGLIQLARGNWEEAEDMLKRGVSEKMKPFETARFRVALGKCLLRRGQREEARQQILRGFYVLGSLIGSGPYFEEAHAARLELRRALGEPPPGEVDVADFLEGQRLEEGPMVVPPMEGLLRRDAPAESKK